MACTLSIIGAIIIGRLLTFAPTPATSTAVERGTFVFVNNNRSAVKPCKLEKPCPLVYLFAPPKQS
jgi:hypothetical protein